MKIISEFKAFAMRGNVVDMAVGVIIGGAFGKIVSSFVADVVMPPLGLLMGNANFSHFRLTLKAAGADGKPVTLNYGAFVTQVLDFILMALAVFLMVRAIAALRRDAPAAPPAPTEKECPECLFKIPLKARRCGHCAAPQP